MAERHLLGLIMGHSPGVGLPAVQALNLHLGASLPVASYAHINRYLVSNKGTMTVEVLTLAVFTPKGDWGLGI